MKCPNCSMNINDNSKFCIHCGKQFNVQTEKRYCLSCGAELIDNSNFCGVCGMELKPKVIQNNQVVSNNPAPAVDSKEESNATLYGIISLLLYFGGPILGVLFTFGLPKGVREMLDSLSGLFPLAGIVVMIVGRVKYPTNKFLKTVMWIIIGFIIAGIVLFILFFLWCWYTCSTIDTSGCS